MDQPRRNPYRRRSISRSKMKCKHLYGKGADELPKKILHDV